LELGRDKWIYRSLALGVSLGGAFGALEVERHRFALPKLGETLCCFRVNQLVSITLCHEAQGFANDFARVVVQATDDFIFDHRFQISRNSATLHRGYGFRMSDVSRVEILGRLGGQPVADTRYRGIARSLIPLAS
jgi:hypothetical protein